MLDGINEFAEGESQRRWMIRRCVVSVMLMISGYVGTWIPVEYYLNTRSSPAIARMKPIVLTYYRPLNVLRRPSTAVRRSSHNILNYTAYGVRLAERSCQRVDNLIARWAARGYPNFGWWLIAGLLGLVLVYALSPVPLLWGIKFLGIDRVLLVAHLYEWYYAPIECLNDHSATVRSFYEEYVELFALTH